MGLGLGYHGQLSNLVDPLIDLVLCVGQAGQMVLNPKEYQDQGVTFLWM